MTLVNVQNLSNKENLSVLHFSFKQLPTICIFVLTYVHKSWRNNGISLKFKRTKIHRKPETSPPVQARGPDVVSPSLTALSGTNCDATRSKSAMANFCWICLKKHGKTVGDGDDLGANCCCCFCSSLLFKVFWFWIDELRFLWRVLYHICTCDIGYRICILVNFDYS